MMGTSEGTTELNSCYDWSGSVPPRPPAWLMTSELGMCSGPGPPSETWGPVVPPLMMTVIGQPGTSILLNDTLMMCSQGSAGTNETANLKWSKEPTATLVASYDLATNGVPCTGYPLYSTLIVCAPTWFGVNSAVNPACMSPVTRTGSSPCGPRTLTASSAAPPPLTVMTRLVSATEHTNGQPITVSPLNLMSIRCGLACSGVNDTRQRPPPTTCTWFGTSPSLIEISSWPSPAALASTRNWHGCPTTPPLTSVTWIRLESYTLAMSGPPTSEVPPIDASTMCVPTSDGTNSMRSAPLADSCVTRADTFVLLGDRTVATQSLPRIEAPGGGSTSNTAGRLAGTSRVDSPSAVSPGDDIIVCWAVGSVGLKVTSVKKRRASPVDGNVKWYHCLRRFDHA
uniref:Uncharacterized protein n=1 Tax=Anopheles atroparvus TaxID=41427 RepID=A0A182JDF6_ANOAO